MSGTGEITIKRIKVDKLFGLYDYEIPSKEEKKNIDTIMILYGENGSGKTTILTVVFHLLATEKTKGHKTIVSHVKFRSIKIELSNGVEIIARRKQDSLIGTFEMEVIKNEKERGIAEFWVDSDNKVRARDNKEDGKQNELVDLISSLNLSIYFLSDDRRIQASSPEISVSSMYESHWEERLSTLTQREREIALSRSKIEPDQFSRILLEDSIKRATDWIRKHVMRGSTRGESDVNLVYSDIIRRITSSARKGKPQKSITREGLLSRINTIERRNKDFNKFLLLPHFDSIKIVEQLKKASSKQLSLIRRILVPYLDGFEVKFNALSGIQKTINTFTETINSFMVDKSINFNIANGFTIRSRIKERLSTEMLSSGERHLLLLFCNTLTALDRKSIFIIDEPEISLNVKWQRDLISSLLELVGDKPVQYIFATHSMEILAQHLDRVVKLESKAV